MDTLSIIFGFIIGILCGMNIGFERFSAYLREVRKNTIHVRTDTQLVILVPSEKMKDCQFVGIERMETEEE